MQRRYSLSGDEIRFLRKRLGKKQADFSKQLGLEVETLSRIENGHLPASERTDKFIRLYYALASKDPVLLGQMQVDLDDKLATWQRIMPPKRIVATVTDNEWTADLVAA